MRFIGYFLFVLVVSNLFNAEAKAISPDLVLPSIEKHGPEFVPIEVHLYWDAVTFEESNSTPSHVVNKHGGRHEIYVNSELGIEISAWCSNRFYHHGANKLSRECYVENSSKSSGDVVCRSSLYAHYLGHDSFSFHSNEAILQPDSMMILPLHKNEIPSALKAIDTYNYGIEHLINCGIPLTRVYKQPKGKAITEATGASLEILVIGDVSTPTVNATE